MKAKSPHHKTRDYAAFNIKRVFRKLVNICGIYNIRMRYQVIAICGDQSGDRPCIARMTTQFSTNTSWNQKHCIEIFVVLIFAFLKREY
ncbi:uncharacterized protein METZ01_LOCUS146947 [marine metagenome]|uniref:Uncharacterized protein n=1 Tax=marine metagenome TaxID=408172 RepID=A0A381ZZD8_9ZZZZ